MCIRDRDWNHWVDEFATVSFQRELFNIWKRNSSKMLHCCIPAGSFRSSSDGWYFLQQEKSHLTDVTPNLFWLIIIFTLTISKTWQYYFNFFFFYMDWYQWYEILGTFRLKKIALPLHLYYNLVIGVFMWPVLLTMFITLVFMFSGENMTCDL